MTLCQGKHYLNFEAMSSQISSPRRRSIPESLSKPMHRRTFTSPFEFPRPRSHLSTSHRTECLRPEGHLAAIYHFSSTTHCRVAIPTARSGIGLDPWNPTERARLPVHTRSDGIVESQQNKYDRVAATVHVVVLLNRTMTYHWNFTCLHVFSLHVEG